MTTKNSIGKDRFYADITLQRMDKNRLIDLIHLQERNYQAMRNMCDQKSIIIEEFVAKVSNKTFNEVIEASNQKLLRMGKE